MHARRASESDNKFRGTKTTSRKRPSFLFRRGKYHQQEEALQQNSDEATPLLLPLIRKPTDLVEDSQQQHQTSIEKYNTSTALLAVDGFQELLPPTFSITMSGNSAHSRRGSRTDLSSNSNISAKTAVATNPTPTPTSSSTSILGASKKVVSSAVRRPLRSLGKAVGRKESSSTPNSNHKRRSTSSSNTVRNSNSDGGSLGQYGSLPGTETKRTSSISSGKNRNSITSSMGILNSTDNTEGLDSHYGRNTSTNSIQAAADWPVHSMEHITRTLLLVCGAYVVGANKPEMAHVVAQLAEYILTAWITCVLILLLAYFQRTFPQWVPGFRGNEEEALLLANRAATEGDNDSKRTKSKEEESVLRSSSTTSKISTTPKPLSKSTRHTSSSESAPTRITTEQIIPLAPAAAPKVMEAHPALSRLYAIDTETAERLYCNTEKPVRVENEWFVMDVLMLVRTPDVDNVQDKNGLAYNKKWADYLRGKQRRFEFQYQMKLKQIPRDKDFYFACELENPIKMGMIQRAFVGAAMAFMKSTNPTFHYSITGSKERTADGAFERPHMSFTVEDSLNRLVITKPGETPPELGTALVESPEAFKLRKKGLVEWNLQDTYTMALWSAYVDFLDWRVINLPGIRPFALTSVLGVQPFHLTMYMVDKKRDSDKHLQKDLTYVVNWELSNDKEAEKGSHASKWAKADQRKRIERVRSSSTERARLSTADSSSGEADLRASLSAEEALLEEAEDDDDAETAAELGEGIYMRSGDSVCLKELICTDDIEKDSFVSNGGGFAVLQEQDVKIVIEKTRRSKKNRLIKAGDTVMFKMVSSANKDTGTRYLTIHRGWWLKWVTTVPSKNGFFTINHHDRTKDDVSDSSGSQSTYMTMGGAFTLTHKRWSNYCVGVAGDPSPTYGGRMLGLYDPKKTQMEEQYHSDEGEIDEADVELKTAKPAWMRPLVLVACEPQESQLAQSSPRKQLEIATDIQKVVSSVSRTFSHEHSQADVSAWIEMMNRRDRVRQLTYVVRVTDRPKEESKSDENEDSDIEADTFVRLRTGRELARTMRIGQRVKLFGDDLPKQRGRISSVDVTGSFPARTPRAHSTDPTMAPGTPPSNGKKQGVLLALSPRNDIDCSMSSMHSLTPQDEDSEVDSSDDSELEGDLLESDDGILPSDDSDEEDIDHEVVSESEESEDEDLDDYADEATDAVVKKKRGMVGKSKRLIGKSVKATAGGVKKTGKLGVKGVKKTAKLGVKTTKFTGKAALGTAKLSAKAVKGAGKFTGKAAVGTTKVAYRSGRKAMNAGKTAGRRVIAPVSRKSKKPPKTEPKAKLKEKGHVSVSKSLKKMAKSEKKKSQAFIAGELCAPEQSRRSASRLLSRMSNLHINAPYWKECNTALKSQVEVETDQDRWFLEGNSVELGVTPILGDELRGKLLHESLVARCLWESHWREEWAGIFETCVSYYTPLSKSPCTEIAYMDITSVRPLDAGAMSPLPGFPLLVLETAWLCHYIAFRDEATRDTFGEKVETAIDTFIKTVEEKASLQEDDLRKARFWQGFQALSETSLSSGNSKWAKFSSKDKVKERAILNGRRMSFDRLDMAEYNMSNGFAFVEDILRRALSFSIESLENDPESFVEFLDLTSQLRILPIDEIDISDKSSLCLFANIYHCLLQQAMLLSVNGPLHKKTVNNFMRTVCYEIGGDVFSLAELYCCVIRGKLSKPINPKAPYIEAPKKSQAYRHYALDFRDPRVNFLLNTGDMACPNDVPILRPDIVEEQLNDAAAIFLQKEVGIEPKKGTVTLPKVCEVYKNDFGGDSMACLQFCMGGLDEGVAGTIRVMMMNYSSLTIRYRSTSEHYHTSLRLREDVIEGSESEEVLT